VDKEGEAAHRIGLSHLSQPRACPTFGGSLMRGGDWFHRVNRRSCVGLASLDDVASGVEWRWSGGGVEGEWISNLALSGEGWVGILR